MALLDSPIHKKEKNEGMPLSGFLGQGGVDGKSHQLQVIKWDKKNKSLKLDKENKTLPGMHIK